MLQPRTRHLIANADDYGLSPSVSAGIRAAHLDGIVTSTTAMYHPRARELVALRAARVRQRVEAAGVRLVDFGSTTGAALSDSVAA